MLIEKQIPNSAEGLINKPKLFDIRYLDYEKELLLSQKIAEKEGEVLVLIHPFYKEGIVEYSDLLALNLQYAHANRIRDAISEGGGVIFVFSDSDEYDSTKLRVLTLKSSAYTCMVPTELDNPMPKITTDRQSPWEYLNTILKRLGVLKIKLGGRLFEYNKFGFPSGCVPITHKELIKKFEVEFVPGLCYPDRPL